MALIDSSYTPPGVYTQVVLNPSGAATLTGNARVPVVIGEGEEFFTQSNIEIHRGSSATSDDAVVGENISDQVTGTTRNYQLTHYPVVDGSGGGIVTNDVSKITVVAGGQPVSVVSLNGATGQFSTASLIPVGTNVTVNYFFKRTDTQILNEDATAQIPSFASLTVETALALSLSIPGALGNNVTLALTLAASGHNLGVADAQAVTGAGTDTISIELRKPDDSVRQLSDIQNLVNAGIETVSGGFITVVSLGTNATATAITATNFAGGAGQSTNTVFKTVYVPIVDGTNGGVVTTSPSDVQAKVNGNVVAVTAVDGANGLITLQNAVPAGATLEFTYFTNTYQDTSDLLPSANVASITEVGLGPDRADYTEGVDYVLNGNSISWGATATTAAGQSTPGFTPIDATDIVTTLVDEKVYLQLCSGASSGRNAVFTLPDTPVDGSGLGVPTDNPSLVSIYVGPDPITAAAAGAVRVSRLSGASAQVTLFNPAPAGSNVYATFYRSTLNDHEFTVSVATAGQPGQGTYTIADELGAVVPVAKAGTATVTDANFTNTGLVFPNNTPDVAAALGGADETVTVTFQNDSLTKIVTPAVQASLTISDSGSVPRITFRATTPGTAGNGVTIALVGGGSGQADANAISVSGSAITVETLKADNVTTRAWQDIVNLFATYPPTVSGAGVILCTGVTGADLTPQASSQAATHLANGAAAITTPFANRFKVTTSRTSTNAAADGLGLTGGATTGSGNGAVGYLGQTYIDPITAVKFTVVDPATALSYGFTQLPSPSYSFQPGDTLTFTVSREATFLTGATIVAIPGLKTKVVTTLGMNPTDTAVISTFNRAGNSPAVGEYYFVSFTTNKQATDFGLQTFTSKEAAYAVYGQPSAANRLSLAIYFLTLNGAGQFGAIQVQKQSGLPVASDQAFIDAINSLAKKMPGGRKPNAIVPMSTSATVQQALGLFLTKQAGPRFKGEAQAFIGFDAFTSPNAARATAQAIANRRVIAVQPCSVGWMYQAANSLQAVEVPLTGEFVAAALAGLAMNPANDPAQTLTGQVVVGFSQPLVTYDDPTMDLLASSGITVLEGVPGGLEVRDYKTTDPSNPLTSEPTVTTISDFVAQAFRKNFKQFMGRKMTPDLPSTMEATGNALLVGYMNALITAYAPCTATPDAVDPTTVDVAVSYKPMFCAKWINVTFTVNLTQ